MKKIIIFIIVFSLMGGLFTIGYQLGKNRRFISKLPSKEYIFTINQGWFDYFSKLVTLTNTDEKYYLLIENKGKVIDINRKGKKVGKTIFPLGIKLESGKINDWIWISPDLFRVLAINLVINNVSYPGNIDNIKIGNYVILQEIIDLSYAPSDKRHSAAFVVKIIK